jgi:predicted GIY-YIG superfamily endonuclease
MRTDPDGRLQLLLAGAAGGCYYASTVSFGTVATTAVSLKAILPAVLAISRAAAIALTAILVKMLVQYAVGNMMIATVNKAVKENRKPIAGTHTVYVLIADAAHGGGVFYVGRTKNFAARYSAHKANAEKKKYGGNFTMQAVYVGLNLVSAKAYEQGLMTAFGTHVLINKYRAIARGKIGPQYFTQAVLSNMKDVAENEWLYWLGK